MIAAFRQEIRPMLRLAAPLAMAELGWMSMGFVDAVMAGRLGAAAIGAGSLGNMLFFPIAIQPSSAMASGAARRSMGRISWRNPRKPGIMLWGAPYRRLP